MGAEQFLAELQQKFPDLADADDSFIEAEMRIHPPVDPLFRVGELGLGYDAEQDQIVLIAKELIADEQAGEQQEEQQVKQQDEQQEEPGKVVRFWCTRSQLRAMCKWGSPGSCTR